MNDWYQNLLHCLCTNVSIDNVMRFGVDQGVGVLFTPMALAHPLIPLEAGREIRAETCGLDDVLPLDNLDSGPYSPFIIICIPYIKAAL